MISLYVFIGLMAIGAGAAGWFLRQTIGVLAKEAAEHAKVYSLAYAKGATLISIAVITGFDENFRNLTSEEAAAYQWWNWTIIFMKPLLSGLAVFAAFLDRSVQRAQESRTNPPFPKP